MYMDKNLWTYFGVLAGLLFLLILIYIAACYENHYGASIFFLYVIVMIGIMVTEGERFELEELKT